MQLPPSYFLDPGSKIRIAAVERATPELIDVSDQHLERHLLNAAYLAALGTRTDNFEGRESKAFTMGTHANGALSAKAYDDSSYGHNDSSTCARSDSEGDSSHCSYSDGDSDSALGSGSDGY
jgi:hypothetical protein